MTSSGIYGTITEVEEETVLLEISEDVQIRMAKNAVSRTFTVREEPEEDEEEEEHEAIREGGGRRRRKARPRKAKKRPRPSRTRFPQRLVEEEEMSGKQNGREG